MSNDKQIKLPDKLLMSKSELLRNAFLKAKLNFANIYITDDGGTGSHCDFDVLPNDFLGFAKRDILTVDNRGRINAITNAKRSIDCQTDKILSILNIKFDKDLPEAAKNFIKLRKGKHSVDEKQSLKLIEALGLAPISLISKVRRLRHLVEHYYEIPTVTETQEAIELAELFIGATDNKINMIYEMLVSNEEYDFSDWSGLYYSYYENGQLKCRFKEKTNNEIIFDNTDVEFYYFMKISFLKENRDELKEVLTGLLNYIKHPQADLVSNVLRG